MAEADMKVNDINSKIDSNANEEKEPMSDVVSQKKKRNRKNKNKKKKSNDTSNAEKVFTDIEKEMTNNVDSESKRTDDNENSEKKTIINMNEENQTNQTVDRETNAVDEAYSEQESEDTEPDEEMADVDMKVRLKGINLKVDSNANEEKETASDVIPRKRKKNRKNKKKKKKSKGTANAEKTFSNTENKRTEDNVNEENQTTETDDKETNTFDEGYSEQEPYDAELDEEITAYIYEKSLYFANSFECYLTRCYDIFNRGESDIPENATDLPYGCRILLRGSINRYKSTNYFTIFRPTVNLHNRHEDLRSVFREALVLKGGVVTHAEFLRHSALYFLTAYDLKHTLGFAEAPSSAINALVDAIMATKQQELICLWYPFD